MQLIGLHNFVEKNLNAICRIKNTPGVLVYKDAQHGQTFVIIN